MILTIGGIKGGSGKSTIATQLAVRRSKDAKVLLIDADSQGTSADFCAARATAKGDSPTLTCVQLEGANVRSEGRKLAPNFDTVIIDAGGRDTAGQRAALTISNIVLIPIRPRSFDVWTLEAVQQLVGDAKGINEALRALVVVSQADVRSSDNRDAEKIVADMPGFELIDATIRARKAFATAGGYGLGVGEMKDSDAKAIREVETLYECLFSA
jgi:chromosome partitioning protein